VIVRTFLLCAGLLTGAGSVAAQTQGPLPAPAQPAPTTQTIGPPPAPLTKSQTAGQSSGAKSITASNSTATALDYAAWEQLAQRAERTIGDPATSNSGLELVRGQLVDWRAKFQTAQSTNATRIQSQRDQITALGPAPAEGEAETPEIAERRKVLNEQLQRLEAPKRAADEAYRRANGLIAEIDRELRERQTQRLLKLWPTPANPANWDDALIAMGQALTTVAGEVRGSWGQEKKRIELRDRLPAVGILLLVAMVLIFRGRRWIERFANWLNTSAGSMRWSSVLSFIASLGQVIVPTLGVLLISIAVVLTEMPGYLGKQVLSALPSAGFAVFAAYWLAGRIFPKDDCASGPLAMTPGACAEGRFYTTMIGAIYGAQTLREALVPAARQSDEALPVLALPLILLMSLVVWRLGRLLSRNLGGAASTEEATSFRDRVLRVIGRLLIVIAYAAPALGLIGYTTAANALIFPAAASLGLAGVLLLLVQLIADIWRALTGGEDEGHGLMPVIAGFVLTLASLPLFALLWGVRVEDLSELWNRFTQGVTLGDTRISPSNFLYFLLVFGVGYGATRLFQGALKSSILPKTRLDQGGRNAVVSGVGYLGIFISGIIAVSSAGIDLSGLAIVASALSLGIGFGLQTIVQNFVAGIILLIERPVSEGDWIEVGGVSGTIKSISVRSTRIQTFDRSDVIVPNGDLISQQVTNWTRFSLAGRVIIPIGVDYSSDTRKVAHVLQQIAEAQPLAVLEPPPVVAFMGFGADSMMFEIRMIIRDVNFSLTVRTEVNHQIAERFEAEGIKMPFSQRDIWLRNPDAVAAALASLHDTAVAAGSGGSSPARAVEPTALRRDDHIEDAPAALRDEPRGGEDPFDVDTER
jgi:small-conductance mechanosensitive channel